MTPAFSKIPFCIVSTLIVILLPMTYQAPDLEETILLKLKQFWSNPTPINHWVPSSNTNLTHCEWPEITCTGGSVTGLNVSNKNITGSIPPFICDLKNLTTIDLGGNYIIGSFPASLYKCSKLEVLDLSENYFVGPIPDDIDKLSVHLQSLNLGGNNFRGDIPAAIGQFPELRTLRLFQNEFHGGSFPPDIGNLSNLEWLELSDNDFKPMAIPPSFTQLKKLKKLWVKNSNVIGEIPETIRNLTELEFLDLSRNNLSGNIPNGLFQLKNLKIVYLYINHLSGEIPKSIGALSLEIIDLSENNLNGTVPDDFGRLMKLSGLALFDNQFSGELPESMGRLPSLIDLKLFNNRFSGPLPPDLGLYSKLRDFEIPTNYFTGKLPKHLCAKGALTGVVAHENNLSGELPDSLGNCNTLVIVWVHDNQLSGDVPRGLWTSSKMMSLILSNNYFTGQLPDRLASNLSRIEISNNKFSGKIPTGVSSWKNLSVFQASNNLLHGNIPQELTTLPDLTILLLDGNGFWGQLPENIVSWNWLTQLNLSRNQLSGRIPAKIGSLPRLTELDLSRNEFSGHIPSQIVTLKLTFLNLSSNRLSGRIPHEFDNAAFNTSFLNNSGLCGTNPSLGLHSCSSSSQRSRKISCRLSFVLVSIAAIMVALAILSIFLARTHPQREELMNLKWEFTRFFPLNFTEMDIVRGLVEKNVIGYGGWGKVYRVDLKHFDEVVAVKRTWNKKTAEEDKTNKEFLAEVQILGKIRHSNIVKMFCCISSDTEKLLVYEYMENQSLDRWLHENKKTMLDWPKRMKIAEGAAMGLCYMHDYSSPPVIHRDVKSSNILLDSEFNAKIADFGLAKIFQKLENSNTTSTVVGSTGYMAPECGQGGRLNEKVDVYSFGVVLLELVTGRKASNGDDGKCLTEWVWLYVQQEKPIKDALDKEVVTGHYLDEMTCVFKLGTRCTQKISSARPSMKEVLETLQRCNRQAFSGGKNIETEFEYAPLLKNSRREVTKKKNHETSEPEGREAHLCAGGHEHIFAVHPITLPRTPDPDVQNILF